MNRIRKNYQRVGMTGKFLELALLIATGLAFATPSHAMVVNADSASASSFYAAGYEPENTIDGSGLGTVNWSTDNPTAISHGAYASGSDNHWTSGASTNPLNQWITWSFNSAQTLGGIYIWNHQSSSGHASNSGYEPTLFDLTLYDSSNTAILFLNDVALLPDTAVAQLIGFNTLVSGISSIRFDVEATQSSPSYTGLAEVRFETDLVSAVPLPAALPLLGCALGALGLFGRRRKATAA